MKKFWIIGTLAALALIVFGVVGYAYAQSRTPTPTPQAGSTGNGSGTYRGGMMSGGWRGYGGMMGNGTQGYGGGMMGRGMMGYGANSQGYNGCPMADGDENGTLECGPMHDTMINAIAQALGITPQELETRVQAGDTPWVIAQGQGLTKEQFQEKLTTALTTALNQAVSNGVITQAQADFMRQHMGVMLTNGFAPGFGGCFYNNAAPNNQP